MRVLEMSLLFCNLVVVALSLLFYKDRRTITVFIASGIATLTMCIHWLIEGYRIQLGLLYVITVMWLAVSAYRQNKTTRPRISRFIRRLTYTLTVMLLLTTAGLMYIFPVFKLPAPTGRFQVGTQAFHFVDTDRSETVGNAEGFHRELMVQVWYPAQVNSTRSYAPWIASPALLSHMAAQYGLPGFTFQYLKYVPSHSSPGADVDSSNASYPLIIANPGNASSRFLHTSQAEELASHGYIVAVIDHTGNTFATEFPDGRIMTNTTDRLFSPAHDYRTESHTRDKLGRALTENVSFVLDQFELLQSGQIPSRLKGTLDLSHIGIFGHSIGGATAYNASYDPRITAGINLDGGLYRLHDRTLLHKPFMFIDSESNFKSLQRVMQHKSYTDAELQQMGSTREWEEHTAQDKWLELQRMQEAIKAGGAVLYIDHTEHLNFTDAQFISPIFRMVGATGQIEPQRANAITNAYILDFFDTNLKNKRSVLLKERTSPFPEVKFADLSSH